MRRPTAGLRKAALAVACALGSSEWGLSPEAIVGLGLFTQPWALLYHPLAVAHAHRLLGTGRGLAAVLVHGLAVGLCHPFMALPLAMSVAVLPGWRRSPAERLGRAAWCWRP